MVHGKFLLRAPRGGYKWRMPNREKDEKGAIAFFEQEKTKFIGLLKHAHFIGNAVGNRTAGPL